MMLTNLVNVALNKPAGHSGHVVYDASKAVDGRKSDLSGGGGQCAVSIDLQTATWLVDLTSIYSIHHITIYFRTENKPWGPFNTDTYYPLGFSVYVSNTTDRLQGTLCYKDDNFTLDTIPAVFTTTCPVHGRYVIYYNERLPGVHHPRGQYQFLIIGLCEVEVYGCPGGFYGTNCSIACPDINCYCHIETGTCQVCKHGYQSYLCKLACDSGWYGLGCSERCGQCRDVDRCLNTNGTCLTGCSAGYTGHTCHTRCPELLWGEDCVRKCPDKCKGCNNINGLCESGCVPGWKGYHCSEACGRGLHGAECQEKCGHCRDLTQCVHTNGSCLTGCDDGYDGEMCNAPCPHGLFGLDCADRCNDTCDGCNNINGSCDSGCNPGWQGYDCQYACDEGSFGVNCSEKCGHCRDVNQCSNINGTCLTGCAAGYQGNLCKTPCPYGFFGPDCAERCNDTCDGCNKFNGSCDFGCNPGWKGYNCKDACDQGSYEKMELHGVFVSETFFIGDGGMII
uniref:EGF-like domain-containing protein n=1 Tax=Magallana gigas TaxID=29159 RepID=A0A8W8MNT0_MAGGI